MIEKKRKRRRKSKYTKNSTVIQYKRIFDEQQNTNNINKNEEKNDK